MVAYRRVSNKQSYDLKYFGPLDLLSRTRGGPFQEVGPHGGCMAKYSKVPVNTRLTADLNLAVNQRIKAVKRGSTTDVKKGSALVHKYNNMPIKKCVR